MSDHKGIRQRITRNLRLPWKTLGQVLEATWDIDCMARMLMLFNIAVELKAPHATLEHILNDNNASRQDITMMPVFNFPL